MYEKRLLSYKALCKEFLTFPEILLKAKQRFFSSELLLEVTLLYGNAPGNVCRHCGVASFDTQQNMILVLHQNKNDSDDGQNRGQQH